MSEGLIVKSGIVSCPVSGGWLPSSSTNIQNMKISARNILSGTVKAIKKGPISSIVTLEIAPGVEVVASITSDSATSLKLKKGQKAYAIVKASSVLVGVD